MKDVKNMAGVTDTVEFDIKPEEEIKSETETKPKAAIDAPDSGSYDAIIIGGGPAGTTGGVYLARKMINTLLISPDLGGQVLRTSEVENYPGFKTISGWELANEFKENLMQYRIHLRIGDRVVAVELSENGGIVQTEMGSEYSFKSLVVATGTRSRLLGVPGEKEFYGRGVTYCATCDGPLYKGEKVAVIGGGNSALTAANDLLSLGCTVQVINFLPEVQADAVLVEKSKSHGNITFHTNHQIEEIVGDMSVNGIIIHDRESGETAKLDVSGVFIEIGLIPNSTFAEGILELNDRKEIVVDCFCRTNIPGIFAAGDVTNVPNKQIIIAAGEGAKAALGINDYLLKKKL
ncbi:MAG TPA: thioredoxin-disulfide reductase [bacterium]|nr:thioredoxin-disulfide reductase [bacterium]